MGVKLVASGGGSVEINPPSTSANFIATMPAGTGTVSVNGVSSNIVLGTAQNSTSGTSIDFTGIPSWARRITVMFSGISTNAASGHVYMVQLGDSGGIENSGYLGSASTLSSALTSANFTTGFWLLATSTAAATVMYGQLTLTKFDGNKWIASGVTSISNVAATFTTAGEKTLSDTLTQIRLTTFGGTDVFDAGSVNIMYE